METVEMLYLVAYVVGTATGVALTWNYAFYKGVRAGSSTTIDMLSEKGYIKRKGDTLFKLDEEIV